MIEIRTYPHRDEYGNRVLRTESFIGVCVRGSYTPDVCPAYHLKGCGKTMIELCSKDGNCKEE